VVTGSQAMGGIVDVPVAVEIDRSAARTSEELPA